MVQKPQSVSEIRTSRHIGLLFFSMYRSQGENENAQPLGHSVFFLGVNETRKIVNVKVKNLVSSPNTEIFQK